MESIECIELMFPKCPICNRSLKPSMYDLLVCRYCKVSVNLSVLRNQKNPIKFVEDFKKIPLGCKISEDTKEKIRLREDHKENMERYNHYPIPNKCPHCKSEDIVADCSKHGWICISCDEYFEWHNFRIIFHGDVELEAESKECASEKGYVLLEKGVLDIEADVDWM